MQRDKSTMDTDHKQLLHESAGNGFHTAEVLFPEKASLANSP